MSCEFCRVSFDCWLTIREVTPKSMYASFFYAARCPILKQELQRSRLDVIVSLYFCRASNFDCCLTIREDTPKSKFVRHYARHFYFTTRTCRVSLIVVLLYVKARWINFTRIMSYNFVPRIAPIVALLYVKARQKSMCARLNFTSTIWSTYKTL